MLQELDQLLMAMPPNAPRRSYTEAIIEHNALGKQTGSTRNLTHQRLCELYGLDPAVPLFRVLRRLWALDPNARPQLALLCALARDPLLRATAPPVLSMQPGNELARQVMTDALRQAVGDRLNDSTLDKVVRNTSASWSQSGHLQGRARKIRRRVIARPASTTYALMLGYLLGQRGSRLFESLWTAVLDSNPSELRALAAEAKRHGWLDMKLSGDVVEIHFPQLLTPAERRDSHGTD